MIELVKYSEKHRDSLVQLLNNKSVSDWLLLVPYPYTLLDAYWWLNKCKETEGNGKDYSYAIEYDGIHVGGIGLRKKFEHAAEIGYWLGEIYWGKGYMKHALNDILLFAVNELNLVRISAEIFEDNVRSEKLLKKCGFEYEGTLKKKHKKGDRLINAKLYSFVV
jgi:[ribosomal protein S5]-alanine N-acetyltransferase